MAFILDGTTGIATVDGSVSAPSQRGQDTNSGISYAADSIKFSTNGVERMAITNSGVTGTGLGGGPVKQVKTAFKTDTSSHTGNTFGAISGLSVSLAKTNAANKLLAFIDINGGRDGTIFMQFRLYQDGSDISSTINSAGGSFASFINWYSDNSNGNHGAGDNANINASTIFDGPNDTNSHTYQIYGSSRSSGRVIYVNRRGAGTSYSGTSCLTIFEVEP